MAIVETSRERVRKAVEQAFNGPWPGVKSEAVERPNGLAHSTLVDASAPANGSAGESSTADAEDAASTT